MRDAHTFLLGTRANRAIVIAITAKAMVFVLCCMHGRPLANGDEK